MYTHGVVARVISLFLALVPLLASAYVGPPSLSPPNPVAGMTLTLSLPYGVCDAVGEAPGFPQITTTETGIRILFFTVHAPDDAFCIYPMSTASTTIGPFTAGEHTVQVDREYDNGSITIETLGVLPVTVQAAPTPIEAPSVGVAGKELIFMLIALIGCIAVRRRARNSRMLALAVIFGSFVNRPMHRWSIRGVELRR